MTTWQLIILRLYMLTLGRAAFFAAVLRKIMVRALIEGKATGKYNASSRFFSLQELE